MSNKKKTGLVLIGVSVLVLAGAAALTFNIPDSPSAAEIKQKQVEVAKIDNEIKDYIKKTEEIENGEELAKVNKEIADYKKKTTDFEATKKGFESLDDTTKEALATAVSTWKDKDKDPRPFLNSVANYSLQLKDHLEKAGVYNEK